MDEVMNGVIENDEGEFNDAARTGWFDRGRSRTFADRSASIREIRVASLLPVLSEIDETARGFVNLTGTDLSGLVLTAITACGFTDPAEVRLVVENVLQALEAPEAPLHYAL
jgi:hypothetical protein